MAHRVALEGRDAELARGYVAEGGRGASGLIKHRAEVVAAPLLEHGGVRHGAGGDDADNIALYESLRGGGVLDLLADGDLVALGDEAGDIALAAVIRHAAHGGALFRIGNTAVARRQREIQLPRRYLRVLVEHLVKIAEAEKQQAVGVPGLYLVVLLFHRRKLRRFLTCHLTAFSSFSFSSPARKRSGTNFMNSSHVLSA